MTDWVGGQPLGRGEPPQCQRGARGQPPACSSWQHTTVLRGRRAHANREQFVEHFAAALLQLRQWMAGSQRSGTGSTRAGEATRDVRFQPIPPSQCHCPLLACPTGTRVRSRSDSQARTADRPRDRAYLVRHGNTVSSLQVTGAIRSPPYPLSSSQYHLAGIGPAATLAWE
jgi:hypothetical protein